MPKLSFAKNNKYIRWVEYSGRIVLFIIGILLYLWISGHVIGWNLLTGEWVAYSSEKYCYSLQYPGRWILYSSGDRGWHGGVRPNQRLMLLESPRILWFDQMDFTIDQFYMEDPTLEKVAHYALQDPIHKSSKPQDVQLYTINNKPALIRFFPESGIVSEAYIAREADGLILRMRTTGNQEDAEDTFRQIIATFSYSQLCK